MNGKVEQLQAQLDRIDRELRRVLTDETSTGVPLGVRVAELIEESKAAYALWQSASREQSAAQAFQELEADFLDLCRADAALKDLDRQADAFKVRIAQSIAELKLARQILNARAENQVATTGYADGWRAVVNRGRYILEGIKVPGVGDG